MALVLVVFILWMYFLCGVGRGTASLCLLQLRRSPPLLFLFLFPPLLRRSNLLYLTVFLVLLHMCVLTLVLYPILFLNLIFPVCVRESGEVRCTILAVIVNSVGLRMLVLPLVIMALVALGAARAEIMTAHRAFAHPNLALMQLMSRPGGILRSILSAPARVLLKSLRFLPCVACVHAKQTKASVPRVAAARTAGENERDGARIASDIAGPFGASRFRRNRFFVHKRTRFAGRSDAVEGPDFRCYSQAETCLGIYFERGSCVFHL